MNSIIWHYTEFSELDLNQIFYIFFSIMEQYKQLNSQQIRGTYLHVITLKHKILSAEM